MILYSIESIWESLSIEENIQGETINCNLLLNNCNLLYVALKKLILILEELENYVENKVNYKLIQTTLN